MRIKMPTLLLTQSVIKKSTEFFAFLAGEVLIRKTLVPALQIF